ncbi:relaxase/mobilization nuclease domain-containing protein [Arthrobacter sp. B1805]|uniref:relaxase/mobilization nuclease domain-containing protein n=1 Tax=Arthrobacter sp. B1805 TaxID=2058892 RepID=UPI000CE52455|nr:relaxase/mobilization nuclease domain-containing protein [Arthrobacter sp. B1805]
MIAKITRGERAGDIAAYLHGPGKANEHTYTIGNVRRSGGLVIGGNLGRDGHTDGASWAADLREAVGTRPEIRKPIWQVSLRTAPGDRRLSSEQWRDAATIMARRMGYEEHPWVMVRHGEDHVHIVVSRVSDTGQVWHARQDFRAAQSAATALEKHFGLTQASRQKAPERVRSSQKTIIENQQQAAVQLAGQRAKELAEFLEVKRMMDQSFPTPPQPGKGPKSLRSRQNTEMNHPVRDHRPERGFER